MYLLSKRFKRSVAGALLLATLGVVPPALAEKNAATLALAKTAIENMKFAQMFAATFERGVSESTVSQSVKDKTNAYFSSNFKKVLPHINAVWTAREAEKFNLKELGDIVEVSDIPYFQHFITNEGFGKPAAKLSEMSAEQSKIFHANENKAYVGKFFEDLLKIGDTDPDFVRVRDDALAYARKLQ